MGQDYGRVVMEGEGIQAALERISEEIIDSTEDPGKLALVGIHSEVSFWPTGLRPLYPANSGSRFEWGPWT